jgi:hypothetical protein
MTTQLRSGIVENKPEAILEKEVEIDEAYMVAGFRDLQRIKSSKK